MPRSFASLTLEDAKRMLSAAEAKAASLGIAYNIAVVDAGGHLVRLWVLFLLTYPQRRQAVERLPAVEARLLNPP